MCAHMCMESETRTGARGFLHLVAQEWRQTLQASGSKQLRQKGRGSGGFGGTLFVLLTLRPLELMGIEPWYWVQSDRMGPPPLRTPHVLNTWGQEEVFNTAMLSSQIISLPEQSQDQRIDRKISMKNTRSHLDCF